MKLLIMQFSQTPRATLNTIFIVAVWSDVPPYGLMGRY
jgi:hypothetical protein